MSGAYYTDVQKLAESGDPAAEPQVLTRLQAPRGALLHLATDVRNRNAPLDG